MLKTKKKAITFSFDDGVKQDIRLINIFNKYNLKATFNLNSGRLGLSNIVAPTDVKYIYDGHEIAAHTLTHPRLPDILDDTEVIRQVEQDRITLSELVGYEVCGMAYPGGGENNDARTAKLIRENTGIKYARVWATNNSFGLQDDLYRFNGTVDVYNEATKLFELAENFLELETDVPSIFYLWGHSYEFDYDPSSWDRFEELCALISGKSDIFYGTNKEVLLNHNWR